MSVTFDTAALKDALKNQALALAAKKVSAMAEKLQNYLQAELKTDLAQSRFRDLVPEFMEIQVGVEQTSETDFSLKISTDGMEDWKRDVLAECFENAKKRMMAA